MAPATARGERPAAPTLALAAGLAYAAAEYIRQILVPSPPGVPGDAGGSLLALVSLGVAVAVGPALLLSLVPARPRVRSLLSLVAAAWIFAAAGSWRVLDRAGRLAEPDSMAPSAFLWPGLLLALGAALVVAPLSRRWPVSARVPRHVLLALVLVAVGVLGRQLRVAEPPVEGRGEGKNLLLVTIDTLRRDALGSYGGSPTALDSLGGVAHEAWSVSSWTQPAMASLFSGAIPTGHGSDREHGPDPAVAWWPESLGRSQSAAFVTNPYLRRRFGFDRGFTTFDAAEERPWLAPVARSVLAEWTAALLNARADSDRADTIVGRAKHWLARSSPDQPWLLWVHLLDPHLPYELRGPDGAPWATKPPAWITPLQGHYEEGGFTDLRGVREGTAIRTGEERAALRRLYQSGVDYAAYWTRELILAAQVASGERDLVWVVTSDHGEEFFEEGGFEHGHSLGDAVLAIPLLSSGLTGGPASPRLTDLGPWILASLGEGHSFDPTTGTQLLAGDEVLFPLALGRPPLAVECGRPPMLAEGMLYGPEQTLLVLEGGHGWLREGPEPPVYRVGPCATGDAPDPAAAWSQLEFWRERRSVSPLSIEIDDDLRRQLRALGYVR